MKTRLIYDYDNCNPDIVIFDYNQEYYEETLEITIEWDYEIYEREDHIGIRIIPKDAIIEWEEWESEPNHRYYNYDPSEPGYKEPNTIKRVINVANFDVNYDSFKCKGNPEFIIKSVHYDEEEDLMIIDF